MNDALVLNINLDQCNPEQHMQKACGPDPSRTHLYTPVTQLYTSVLFYGQSFSSFIIFS